MKNNILLIVLDTLRSDRINDKNSTSITPNIDYLISNGVNFTQATCSVHATISSLGSLFSSKWSFKTGLGGKSYDKMDFNVENYLKIISLNNYNIFTVIPEVISNLGFFKNIDKNEIVYPSFERLDDGLGEKILEKIVSMKSKEPWFCYIHLNDLHSPVIAPKSVDNKKFGKNQYDRTLSFIDLWIGKILEKIDLDNTLIIITSDHGQNTRIAEFEPTYLQKKSWQLDKKIPNSIVPLKSKITTYFKKKNESKNVKKIHNENMASEEIKKDTDTKNIENPDVYDDVIRVPLIFAGLNLPQNKSCNQLVNHVDVFPTIAEISKFDKKLDDKDGRNLLEIISNDLNEDSSIYIESPPRRSEKDSHVIGIRTSKFKYFRDIDDSKKAVYLYDLKNDPGETKNIVFESPILTKEMEEELQVMISKNNNEQNQTMGYDDVKKVEKELRKLGYL